MFARAVALLRLVCDQKGQTGFVVTAVLLSVVLLIGGAFVVFEHQAVPALQNTFTQAIRMM
ncbi:MAG: hypothetical protein ACYCRD_04880 [Leptospirillum sp.]